MRSDKSLCTCYRSIDQKRCLDPLTLGRLILDSMHKADLRFTRLHQHHDNTAIMSRPSVQISEGSGYTSMWPKVDTANQNSQVFTNALLFAN